MAPLPHTELSPGRRCWLLIVLVMLLAGPTEAATELSERWSSVIRQSRQELSENARIDYLSAQFLGVPYRADTLGGGPEQTENLVVRLDAVDCFTLLDYVEAMRRAATAEEFRARLTAVRYRGAVSWQTRRHFFSDWIDGVTIVDVTEIIGGVGVRQVEKNLNHRADGAALLPGVERRDRTVTYLPVTALTEARAERLQTGDYIGVYAEAAWLDVSHVGILIRRDGKPYLRHASNRVEPPRVVDVPLMDYLQGKPGILILRPKSL